jgi:multimeric flavodoxin WrbA
MKVVAFNGSARKQGNTALLIEKVFIELRAAGIETELVELAGTHPWGCSACYQCFRNRDRRCAMDNDPLNDWLAKMVEADGIILASPTYFADVSSEMKALIDRAGMTSKANGELLTRKVGASIVAVRRGGAIHAFDTMNHFFQCQQMILVGSTYWNMGIGREIGQVEGDEEGCGTMTTLGRNMAWVLGKLVTGD